MPILKADRIFNVNNVAVNEYLLTNHNVNKIAMPTIKLPGKPLGITIHNTDWIVTAGNTTPAEQYTRSTVNGNMKNTRVHYYVDNVCAWQNLPLDLSGWHAADSSGNGNMKTIAIECIMSSAYNDKDRKSEDNCARLAAALLKQYGLGIEALYTHTHWLNVRDGKKGTVDELNVMRHSYKMCPAYILPHWTIFKAKVQSYLKLNGNETTKTTFIPYMVQVISKDGYLNIRKTPVWSDSDITGTIKTGNIKYTIVEETMLGNTKFGKLKSGAGWISLNENYVRKI